MDELEHVPLQPGYMRLEAPVVEVPVGSSTDWAQWVGGPLDQDYDVVDISGKQSVGGHHALLYATIEPQEAGFTRLWKDEDQTTTRIMGGIGGEGGASSKLPEGIVFRVKKGSYLLLQTHYLNTQERVLQGRAYVDVKMVPKDPTHIVASLFANTVSKVSLPPLSLFEQDITCPIGEDLKLIQISNHMHDYGVSAFTEFTDPSGITHMLRDDATWSGDLALNPDLKHFPADAPQIIPAGSQLHTHCKWNNTTSSPVTFPAEMCVFFGFILSPTDITCNNGKWPATVPHATPSTNGAAASSPAAGASGLAPLGTAGASAPAVPTSGQQCTSPADRAIMDAATWDDNATACVTPCAFDPEVASCVTPCLQNTLGLSAQCAGCNATVLACSSVKCRSACLTDSKAPECRGCVDTMCGAEVSKCKG